jgi:hypothetical protein
VTSPALLDELREVLDRPKFRRWISAAVARESIGGIADDALLLDDPPERPGASPDPDDDDLIALARVAAPTTPFPETRHVLDLDAPDPPVLAPRALLERLDA